MQLHPRIVAEGCPSGQLTLLEEMLRLSKLIKLVSIEHILGRPSPLSKDEGSLRRFVWLRHELHDGCVVLETWLSTGDSPFAPGMERHTAPPRDKKTVVGVATHQEYVAEGAAAAPTRSRTSDITV